jgi:hypothetical protein
MIGGLVGRLSSTTLNMCGTVGAISIKGRYNCLGGIAGSSSLSTYDSLVNCYGIGSITMNIADTFTHIGGIVPSPYGSDSPSKCYSARSFTLSGLPYVISGEHGSNCFWDLEAAGTGIYSDDSLSAGISTARMKTESPFTNSGWDFTYIWQIDTTVNGGYPSFRWLNANTSIKSTILTPIKNQVEISVLNHGNFISYTLPEAIHVSLKLYNLKGVRVATLIDSKQIAGRHVVSGLRNRIGVGYYILVLQAGTNKIVKHFIPLK